MHHHCIFADRSAPALRARNSIVGDGPGSSCALLSSPYNHNDNANPHCSPVSQAEIAALTVGDGVWCLAPADEPAARPQPSRLSSTTDGPSRQSELHDGGAVQLDQAHLHGAHVLIGRDLLQAPEDIIHDVLGHREMPPTVKAKLQQVHLQSRRGQRGDADEPESPLGDRDVEELLHDVVQSGASTPR